MDENTQTQNRYEHASRFEVQAAARVIRKNAVQMAQRMSLEKIRKLVESERAIMDLKSKIRQVEFKQHDIIFDEENKI